jgi:thioesterase domain-containing protein
VEAIAAGYLTEVRSVQPHGPYFLAGYSFGGTVALEMAQQLAQAGERIAFVGLIDTIYDSKYEIAGEGTGSRLERHLRGIRDRQALFYLAKRARKTLDYTVAVTRERLGELPNELRCLMGRAVPYEKRASFYRLIHFRASHRYKPRSYPGSITLFSAKGKADWHRARWSSIALGGLSVHEVEAGHFDIVWPPHSALLARLFDSALDMAN